MSVVFDKGVGGLGMSTSFNNFREMPLFLWASLKMHCWRGAKGLDASPDVSTAAGQTSVDECSRTQLLNITLILVRPVLLCDLKRPLRQHVWGLETV